MEKQEARIFLSYTRKDWVKVRDLYERLKSSHFQPWMDTEDIFPGEEWKQSLIKAIRYAPIFIACLSNNSLNKRGIIQEEIKEALDVWRQKLDSDIYLIPVRLEECDVPEILSSFQWADLFLKNGYQKLEYALREGLKRAGFSLDSQAPSFDLSRVNNTLRKTAIAAIMSKNMSRNLSSNLFSRLALEKELPFNLGWNTARKLAALNSFIRFRLDFLADVSSVKSNLAIPLRFYRDIMCYFKPVYRDQGESIWQQILLNFISGFESLEADNINIFYSNNATELSLETPDADPIFSCYSGFLGAQALYIIMENIIRNSAKHSFDYLKDNKLDIKVDINEFSFDDNLIEVCISDRFGNAKVVFESKGQKYNLVDYINMGISDSLLDNKGNLRNVAVGLREMKICSAYLRNVPPENLDEPIDPPLIEAININDNLGFRFFVKKMEKILVVDNNETLGIPSKKDGIQIIKTDVFREKLKTNIEHEFLILVEPNDILLRLVKANREAIPLRILSTDKSKNEFVYIDFNIIKRLINQSVLIEKVWHIWLQYLAPNSKLLIMTNNQITLEKWQIPGIAESAVESNYILQIDPTQKYIVFDSSGFVIKKHYETIIQMMEEKKIIYYDTEYWTRPIHSIINIPPRNNYKKQEICNELIESGRVKIVLFDRLIQRAANTFDGELGKHLKLMNIIIPKSEIVDLSFPLHSYRAMIKWLNQNLNDTMFFVIDLGILEKLFHNRGESLEKKLTEIESQFPGINIIISGKDLPNSIPLLKRRFIHDSLISRHILEERSKYHLTKILFAARRPT